MLDHNFVIITDKIKFEICLFLMIYLDRASMSTSTSSSFLSNPEYKPLSFPHYSHHRHDSSSSSVHKHDQRPFLHAIKAQRHSDPYSIKWITEGPYRDTGKSLLCEKKIIHLLRFLIR